MNSQSIQQSIQHWAQSKGFDAPYGILTGQGRSQKGAPFLTVTFGRSRTLDVTVEIYNRNFIIVRTSRHGRQVFKNEQAAQTFLDSL